MALCGMISSWIADWLINSEKLSVTNTRKLFQFVGHWIPAGAMLALAYGISCGDHVIAILLLCVAVGFNGASFSGYQVCCLRNIYLNTIRTNINLNYIFRYLHIMLIV